MNGRRGLLSAGFGALSNAELIALLTLTSVLLGVSAAVPLWPALHSAFVDRLAGDHVLTNHPTFAPTDVLDFLREKSPAVSGTLHAAHWSGLLSVFLQMLFAGGIVAALGRPGPFAWSEFFSGCRKNLWHNVKCFLLFAVLLAGIALLAGGAWWAGRKIYEDAPPWSDGWLRWRLSVAAVALLLFALSSLLYDFARAARRRDPGARALRAYASARRLLTGSFWRSLGVFAFWLVFGGALVLLLPGLEWWGNARSWPAIALHTILQLGVLAVRSAVRVGAWGSLLALYDERAAFIR
jgi:hypothetical protein